MFIKEIKAASKSSQCHWRYVCCLSGSTFLVCFRKRYSSKKNWSKKIIFLFFVVIGVQNGNAQCRKGNKTLNKTVAEDQSKCPDACITLYQPVCGRNNDEFKVFSNGCFLGMHNCKSDESTCA